MEVSQKENKIGGVRNTKTRRFCRCIKAVKKTGKTERGAIAICVHSVLQKKGRTLRRFNCGRKAAVETQRAGRFLTKGADTCVYDPPVACEKPITLPEGEFVSRIVPLNVPSGVPETKLQNAVQQAVDRSEKRFPGQLAPYVNLAVAKCYPNLSQEDVTSKEGATCTIHKELQSPGVTHNFANLVTRKQGMDLDKSPAKEGPGFILALQRLFRAVLLLNAEGVVHDDIHPANIAWMGDRLVLNDWGRVLVGRDEFRKAVVPQTRQEFDYRKGFPQHLHPCEAIENCVLGLRGKAPEIVKKEFDQIQMAWDTLGLLGPILKKRTRGGSAIPLFDTIPSIYTLEAIHSIKAHVDQTTVPVTIDSLQAIMDIFFDRMDVPPLKQYPVNNIELRPPSRSAIASWMPNSVDTRLLPPKLTGSIAGPTLPFPPNEKGFLGRAGSSFEKTKSLATILTRSDNQQSVVVQFDKSKTKMGVQLDPAGGWLMQGPGGGKTYAVRMMPLGGRRITRRSKRRV
jgi:hypothetical protein